METKQFNRRLSALTLRRIEKLRELLPMKTDSAVVEDAVAHYLGTLERDAPIYQTVPSERNGRYERDHPDRSA